MRNLPGFARFLPVAALFHARTLNVASLARGAGTSRTTTAGYIDILEDTLLAFRVAAYEASLRVREKKHPKLYWVDAGIVRAVKQQLEIPSTEERGALFEGWVANVLRSTSAPKNCADSAQLRTFQDSSAAYWSILPAGRA